MVTLERRDEAGNYRCTTGLADLQEVANGEKKLPPDFIGEDGISVTDAFRAYALPLIAGEAEIEIGPDGLPVYARLAKHMVDKRT